MTNKIIIDGIDVSKCEFLQCGNCEATRDVYGDSSYECKDDDMENCYYKQLKRKEQEYKNVSDIIRNTNVYSDIVDKCRDEILIYPSISERTNYTDNEVDVLTLNAIIRRLEKKEQECEKLKEENEKLAIKCMQNDEVNTFFNTSIEGWSDDPCGICESKQEYPKYKKMIDEIEEYCVQNKHSGWVDVEGIMDIINKARKE